MLEATNPSPAKIPLINGLRGLAILGVVFHHLFGSMFLPGEHLMWYGRLPLSPLTFLSNSFQGVALFFMLSGFVLTLPYVQQRRTMLSWADLRDFYKRRAKRLLPLYYLAILVGIIFIAPPDTLRAFLEQSFFFLTGTFSFTQKYFFPDANFVLWSLSLEILFSLCFPLILFVMQKYGVWRVVLFCLIFALFARFFGVYLLLHNYVSLFTGTTTPVFNTIFCRIDDFVLGMGLAYLYIDKPRLSALWWYLVGFASLFLGFWLHDLSQGVLPLIVQPVTNTLINIGFFSLVAIMLCRPVVLWRWTIENPVLQMIGLMSYSIFVWHGVAIAPLDATLDAWHFVRYIVLVFALSWITYRYVEMGAHKKLR